MPRCTSPADPYACLLFGCPALSILYIGSEFERDGAVLVVDSTSLEFVKGATVSGRTNRTAEAHSTPQVHLLHPRTLSFPPCPVWHNGECFAKAYRVAAGGGDSVVACPGYLINHGSDPSFRDESLIFLHRAEMKKEEIRPLHSGAVPWSFSHLVFDIQRNRNRSTSKKT